MRTARATTAPRWRPWAAVGGDILIVAGYLDQGGKGIIQAALDTGAFSKFFLPDGMVGEPLAKAIGSGLDGSLGTVPGTDSPARPSSATWPRPRVSRAALSRPSPYDAAALILLAMQAAKSSDSGKLKEKVDEGRQRPGREDLSGELGKALKILAEGGDVDYVGASAVELIGPAKAPGTTARSSSRAAR